MMSYLNKVLLDPFKLNISALRQIDLVESLPENSWDFERFDFFYWRSLVGRNWTLTLYVAFIYISLIVLGTKWMKNRRPFDFSRAELIFNIGLAIFNFTGAFRVWPEVHRIFLEPDGIYKIFCVCHGHETKTAFWGFLNLWSRIVELGGTAFIILHKKPLLFLHPYHHVMVIIYAFYYYQAYEVTLRILTVINATVHTFVYSYFVLKGLGFKMPRKLPIFLIALQLSEMFFGIYVNLYGLFKKNAGIRCDREYPGINAALTIYATLFLLFAKLMRDSYSSRRNKVDEAKTA